MRAFAIGGAFGLDNLKIIKKESKKNLEDYDVRVKIKACSLNFRDLMVISGQYNPKQALPLIPLSDGAGEIVEIGPKVTAFQVGDRVCTTFFQRLEHGTPDFKASQSTLGSPLNGVLREEGVFEEWGLIKIPQHLSYVEAATLPCAAVTAFNAIGLKANHNPGDHVLIEGTGGVSLFALQFAKALGLRTIVITSSDEKAHKLRKLEPAHVINYTKNPAWDKTILDITKQEGVNYVIEVGGEKTFYQALKCLKRGGHLFLIGILSGHEAKVDLRSILMHSLHIDGIFVGAKSVFLAMNLLIEHSQIKPVIDKVFPFEKAIDALNYFSSQKHFGKVCLEI